MRHLSMFLPFDNERGYIQCVIQDCYKYDLESLGWVDNSEKLTKVESDPLDGMDKDQIEAYVKDLTGIDIDKRGGLKAVKRKAQEALDEWQKQQNQ